MKYPTDLSNSQWQAVEVYLKDSRKRKHSYREIYDAIQYLVKTGCQWRMLPNDYPKWQLVYFYFSRWKSDGTIEHIQQELVEKERARQAKKQPQPLALLMRSQ